MPHDSTTAAKPVRPKLSPKDEVRALLDRLPDTVTLEDIQYHLDVVVKVLEAEAQLERGEGSRRTSLPDGSRNNLAAGGRGGHRVAQSGIPTA